MNPVYHFPMPRLSLLNRLKKFRFPSFAKKKTHKEYSVAVSPAALPPRQLDLIYYDESTFESESGVSLDKCVVSCSRPGITWINFTGIHDKDLIEQIGTEFQLHPLIISNILDPELHPRIEDFIESYIYLEANMISLTSTGLTIDFDQVSFILSKNFLLTFQEKPGDVFDSIRDLIRLPQTRVRKMGASYLLYALLDEICQQYLRVLDKIDERMEQVEIIVVDQPKKDMLYQLHELKNHAIYLRKSVWPLREVSNGLQHTESPLIKSDLRIYFRDLYYNTIHVIETIETVRDLLTTMIDIYLSSINNKLNEVMKVLTVVSTIVMPLTLISSIYGMNFHYMPELSWKIGYPLVISVMVILGVSMLIMFRRKRWI